jgi:hypothetical protein
VNAYAGHTPSIGAMAWLFLNRGRMMPRSTGIASLRVRLGTRLRFCALRSISFISWRTGRGSRSTRTRSSDWQMRRFLGLSLPRDAPPRECPRIQQ